MQGTEKSGDWEWKAVYAGKRIAVIIRLYIIYAMIRLWYLFS